MPCRSDYMEPTAREAESKAVAEHIVYLFTELDMAKKIPTAVIDAARDTYGNKEKCDEFTALLCSTIQEHPASEIHDVIYDGTKKKSRRLADWWEHHQEVDAKRLAEEEHEAERQRVIDSLTPYQRATLGYD